MHRNRLVSLVSTLFLLPASTSMAAGAVFFGDSLTDSGFYTPYLPPGVGKFTTNPGPVWSESLANRFGWDARPFFAGGNNFAAGGARVSRQPGITPQPPTDAAPSMQQQISAYLASRHGHVDSDGPHFVWIGANDIFAIGISQSSGPDLISGLSPQAYLALTASEAAHEIKRLADAGAKQLVVLNVPDIGASPFGASQGPAGAAGLTALSQGYNSLLFLQLQQQGVNVYVLDAFSLLHEIMADPGRYGFANVTLPACGTTPSLLCTSANFIAPNADQTYLFADGVHPTTAAHRLVADYIEGMLQAPALRSRLSQVPRMNQFANARLFGQAAENAALTQNAGQEVWGSVMAGHGSLAGQDTDPRSIAVGVHWNRDREQILGIGFAFHHHESDWNRWGSEKIRDYSLNLYGAQRIGPAILSGVASLGFLDGDTKRVLRLGPANRTLNASPSGNRLAVAVKAFFPLQTGDWRHGPQFGAHLQHVRFDGFEEKASDGSVSSSLAVGKQTWRAVTGSVGWRASLTAGNWRPYGEVSLNRDFAVSQDAVSFYTSASNAAYRYEPAEFKRTFLSAQFGVQGTLSTQSSVDLGIDAVSMRSGQRDVRLYARLNTRF